MGRFTEWRRSGAVHKSPLDVAAEEHSNHGITPDRVRSADLELIQPSELRTSGELDARSVGFWADYGFAECRGRRTAGHPTHRSNHLLRAGLYQISRFAGAIGTTLVHNTAGPGPVPDGWRKV